MSSAQSGRKKGVTTIGVGMVLALGLASGTLARPFDCFFRKNVALRAVHGARHDRNRYGIQKSSGNGKRPGAMFGEVSSHLRDNVVSRIGVVCAP